MGNLVYLRRENLKENRKKREKRKSNFKMRKSLKNPINDTREYLKEEGMENPTRRFYLSSRQKTSKNKRKIVKTNEIWVYVIQICEYFISYLIKNNV